MEEVFLDKFKGFLTFIVPWVGFILSKKFDDGFMSGNEFGDKSTDIL